MLNKNNIKTSIDDSKPLVSIIICAYNAEKYIKKSIESALNQTYENIEIILVDSDSKDNTAAIIKSFKDSRVIYHYQEYQTLGTARNYGIMNSRGKYITLLDADDVYLPEIVSKQVEFLKTHQEYKIVYCNALHFYSNNPQKFYKKKYKCRSGDVFGDLLKTSLINPNTIMFSREVLDKAGFFNEKRYYPEDWDMWLNMSMAGFKFGFLNEDLVIVEIRKDSLTNMKNQPLYTINAIEMLENLFLKLNDKEKDFYKTEKVLRKLKFKLAIAYLTNNQQIKFLKTFISLHNFKVLFYLIGGILLAIPPPFLRFCLIKLWRTNQIYHSYLVRNK